MDELVDLENYTRCWACGRLILKVRLEQHHVIRKSIKEILPLCILCHDMVDRCSLNDWDVLYEYEKVFQELNQMPEGKYLMTRLLILKIFKIVTKQKEKNETA